jgi:methyl-accepting chemotaxis protein
VIIILVVVVVGLSFILLNKSSDMALSLSRESVTRLTQQQASYWQGREEGYLRVAHVAASYMGTYAKTEPERRRSRFNQFLEALLESEPHLIGIYAVFKPNILDGMDSHYRGAAGSTEEGVYAPWVSQNSGQTELRTYDRVPATLEKIKNIDEKLILEDPMPQKIQGRDTYVLHMGAPVLDPDRNNEVIGIVGLYVSIDAAQVAVDDLIKEHADIGAIAVYSENGTIIASYDKNRIGRNVREADADLYAPYIDEAMDIVLGSKNEGHLAVYSDALKTNLEITLISFAIKDAGKWTVMIGTPEADILEEVREMRNFTIIVSLAAVVIVAIIIFFVATNITKPIIRVTTMLKDISEGEGDLTKRLAVSSKDEIGQMSNFFNLTLDKIHNLIVIIKNQTVDLSNIGTELAANMTETAAAMNEISSNVESVKNQVINQSASVTETNSTMEQITQNINKLNEMIEVQTQSVTQSSSAVEEMLANIASVTQTLMKNAENVRELTSAADSGRTDLHAVVTDIQEIAKESEGLLEINSMMQNIASQTNLLSMNAAIEAAHAGEAGKGFAVVADEIRKLAESSGEQAKTTSVVLKKIKDSVDKITVSTETVLKKFESIDSGVRTVADQEEHIRNAMEEQSEGSKQVLEAVTNLNDVTQKVKAGSDEMLLGSQQIIQEAQNLGRISSEIANSMNEMTAGSQEITTAMNRVSDISSQNKENIATLVTEVEKFKVENK